MDPLKRVDKLRTKYERALAASESRGVAYHQAVVGLLDRGGPDLHRRAAELGVLDEPVQHTVTLAPVQDTLVAKRPRRRRRTLVRAAAGLGAAIVLAALTLGALRVAQAPPFVPLVKVPHVMGMREDAATGRLRRAGLKVQVLHFRRSIPSALFHRVLGVSHPAGAPPEGEPLPKGSTVTLYVAIPRRPAKQSRPHS